MKDNEKKEIIKEITLAIGVVCILFISVFCIVSLYASEIKCTNCEKLYDKKQEGKHCYECGTILHKKIKCQNCNVIYDSLDNYIYCTECGEKLITEKK